MFNWRHPFQRFTRPEVVSLKGVLQQAAIIFRRLDMETNNKSHDNNKKHGKGRVENILVDIKWYVSLSMVTLEFYGVALRNCCWYRPRR